MSYTKEWFDVLSDLDAPEPMRAITLRYLSHPRERDAQVQTCKDLDLVYVVLGVNVYVLSESDSITLRIEATRQAMKETGCEVTEEDVTERAAALLRELVIRQAQTVAVSAVVEAA